MIFDYKHLHSWHFASLSDLHFSEPQTDIPKKKKNGNAHPYALCEGISYLSEYKNIQ